MTLRNYSHGRVDQRLKSALHSRRSPECLICVGLSLTVRPPYISTRRSSVCESISRPLSMPDRGLYMCLCACACVLVPVCLCLCACICVPVPVCLSCAHVPLLCACVCACPCVSVHVCLYLCASPVPTCLSLCACVPVPVFQPSGRHSAES